MSITPPDEEPVEGAYCAESDLRLGDIRLPSYVGSKAQMIQRASDEIDAAIGHIYVTPLNFEDPDTHTVPLSARPAVLTVKKINWLIASGRCILDMAASSEDTNQHAYGLGMLKEGLKLLQQIVDGDLILTGAEKLNEGEAADTDFTGPQVNNEDPVSLVQGFYTQRRPGVNFPELEPQVRPYGIPSYPGQLSG